jgi:hypothetical protein
MVQDSKSKHNKSLSFNIVAIFIVSLCALLLYGWQLQHWGSNQAAGGKPRKGTGPRQLQQPDCSREVKALKAAQAAAAAAAEAAAAAAARPLPEAATAAFSLPDTTLKYFPQTRRCSTQWMQQYAQQQADTWSGQLPARYFVSVAVEAGLADRLAGLMTHFWHAVLTNRAFTTVTYGSVPSFSAMCDSPHLDWTSKPAAVPEEAIEPLKFTYMGERGYPGHKRSLPDTLDPATYQMLYLVNGPSRNLTTYQNSNISSFVSQEDPPYLLASSNRGRTWAMANNPVHKQKFWEFGLVPEDAFMCGFFFLCSPAAAIQRYYKQYWDVLQEPGVLKIGIQIRLGDGVFRGAEKEQPARETLKVGAEWFECARRLEKAYAAPGQKVLWYLNSDSQQLRKAAKAVYGDKLVTDDDLKMTHPDCHQGSSSSSSSSSNGTAGGGSSSSSAACEQAAMEEALQHSLGAMLTFSMADYHVISKASGFGRLGAWMSGRWGNIYQVVKGQGACTPGKPVPPHESAFHYSGV